MSLFCYLDKKSMDKLKDSEIKFEIGINKLNSEEKEHLLMYMYKARHNLLVNLAEEKNKNICLMLVSCALILNLILKMF